MQRRCTRQVPGAIAVAIATLVLSFIPWKERTDTTWGAQIWLPQLHFLFWLLAHESDRVEFWLGPYGRFLRTKKEFCDMAPFERRQQRWGCSEGNECKKKWDDVEVWSGKWVSSSRVWTLEDAFGGPTAQEGWWVHFSLKKEKILLGFCPLTEPQVVSNGLPS